MEKLSNGKWLNLFRDSNGYEIVSRKSGGPDPSKPDAVAVLAAHTDEDGKRSIVLVSQYRPAIGKFELDLPCGLIDEGEDANQAGIREFTEETGFKVDELTSPTLNGLYEKQFFSSAGMTDESWQYVVVECSGKPNPEPGIEVVLVNPEDFVTITSQNITLRAWAMLSNSMMQLVVENLKVALDNPDKSRYN